MGSSTHRTRTRDLAAVPSQFVAVLVAVSVIALLWNSVKALTDTLRAHNVIGAQPMRLVVEGEPLPGLTQEALDTVPAPLSQSPQTVVFTLGTGANNNAAMKAEPLSGITTVQISPRTGANEHGQVTDPWIGVTPSRELAARASLPEVAAQTQQVVFRANMKLGQNVTAARATAASIATIVDGPPVARTPVGRWALSALLAVGVILSVAAWAAARRRERAELARLRTARRRVAGVVLDLDALEVAAPDGAAGGASDARRRLHKNALALTQDLATDPRADSLAREADRAEKASLELEAQADSIFLQSSLAGTGETAAAAWEQLSTAVVAQLEYDGRHAHAARVRSFLESVGSLSPDEARTRWNALFAGVPRLSVELGGPRLSLRALDLTLRALRTPVSVVESQPVRGDTAAAERMNAAARRGFGRAERRRTRTGGRDAARRSAKRSGVLRVVSVAVLGLAVLIVPSVIGAAADRAAYMQDRERFIHPTPFGPSRVVSVETGGDLDGLPPLDELRAAVRDIPLSEDTGVVVLGLPRFDAGGEYAMEILAELRRSRPDLFDPTTMEPRPRTLIVTVGRSPHAPGTLVAGNVFSARPNTARDVDSSLQWRQAVAPEPFMWRDTDAPLPSVSGQVQTIVNNYSSGFVEDSAFAERSQGGRLAGALMTLTIAALISIARGLTSLWRHRRAARAGRQARASFQRAALRLDELVLREDEAALDAAAAKTGAAAAVGLREAGVAYAGRLREELGGLRSWQWRPAEAQRTQTLFAAVVADLERQDESIERAAERALLRRGHGPAPAREGA